MTGLPPIVTATIDYENRRGLTERLRDQETHRQQKGQVDEPVLGRFRIGSNNSWTGSFLMGPSSCTRACSRRRIEVSTAPRLGVKGRG
jgi:hypothetical protein